MILGGMVGAILFAVVLFGLVPTLALAVWKLAFAGLVARPVLGAVISGWIAVWVAVGFSQGRTVVNIIYEIFVAGLAWTSAFVVTEGVARSLRKPSAGWAGVVISVVVSVAGCVWLKLLLPPIGP